MTETTIGIVIKKNNFQDNDEIITILNDSEILTFIALGTRNIKSKNRYALNYGNLISIEFFRARLSNKMSKLKKAIILKEPPLYAYDTSLVVYELIKTLNKIDKTSSKLFKSLVESYNFFGNKYNHHIKTYVSFFILDALGIIPNTNKCVECNRYDRIVDFSFDLGGFICSWHSDNTRAIDFLKGIQSLNSSLVQYTQISPEINKEIYLELSEYLSRYISLNKKTNNV